MSYELKKSERLCSKKIIEALFEGGHKSMSAYPIRAVFMSHDQPTDPTKGETTNHIPAQVMISVSKRHFKHAVDRNRVKRQLREAYRLNKHIITDSLTESQHMYIAFIWLSDEMFDSNIVQAKMQKLLLRICEEK